MHYEFRVPPFAHQLEAIRFLHRLDGRAALLCEPGTGKTAIVVHYLGTRFLLHGPERWLIVCPLGAMHTWYQQVVEHLSEQVPCEMTVLDSGSVLEKASTVRESGQKLNTPATLQSTLALTVLNLDAFSSRRPVPGLKTVTTWDRIVHACSVAGFDGLVIDESHRIKNPNALRTKALMQISRHVPRRIVLSGTPSPHSPLDLYAQLDIVEPGLLDTWKTFRERYGIWGGPHGSWFLGARGVNELQRRIAPFTFVARRDDCLDLPPLLEQTIPVSLTPPERRAYADMATEMLAEVDDVEVSAPNVLARMMRLRQITSGWCTADDGSPHIIGDGKLRACLERLHPLRDADEQVVIFAHFMLDLARLKKCLKSVDETAEIISGATPPRSRTTLLQRFADGRIRTLICQQRAVGISVNELVCARHAVFYGLSERRDDWEQARDRLHRQGQIRPVTVSHLIVPHSVDEAILRAHRSKRKVEDVMMEQIRDDFHLGRDRSATRLLQARAAVPA
jgi:SNF2 family DNA or RNA helicase